MEMRELFEKSSRTLKNFNTPPTCGRVDTCMGGASACAAGKKRVIGRGTAATGPRILAALRCRFDVGGQVKSNLRGAKEIGGAGGKELRRLRWSFPLPQSKLRRLRWFLPLSLKGQARTPVGNLGTPVPTGMAGLFTKKREEQAPPLSGKNQCYPSARARSAQPLS